MDWFKVKVKHCLYSELTIREKCAWIDLMALTAHLEDIPTEKQMLKICGQKTLESLSKRFASDGQDLLKILSKVLEDVLKIYERRFKEKEKMANWREKKQNVTSDVTSIDKIREDKIREDKTTTTTSSSSAFNFYQKNINPMITAYEAEKVKDLIDIYSEDWFIQACKVAIDNDARKIKYIEAVLKKSKEKGAINTEKTDCDMNKVNKLLEEKRRERDQCKNIIQIG